MVLVKAIENRLPTHEEIAVILEFRKDAAPSVEHLRQYVKERGYTIASRSFSIVARDAKVEWHFSAVAIDRSVEEPIAALAEELSIIDGVIGFQFAYARN